ncbi:hypothetical protein C8Q78DRAFT_1014148 [Trametes maxima]|nr:hypothetical protein C8Q78DRAFT_1014148 [Trametes maxima]
MPRSLLLGLVLVLCSRRWCSLRSILGLDVVFVTGWLVSRLGFGYISHPRARLLFFLVLALPSSLAGLSFLGSPAFLSFPPFCLPSFDPPLGFRFCLTSPSPPPPFSHSMSSSSIPLRSGADSGASACSCLRFYSLGSGRL